MEDLLDGIDNDDLWGGEDFESESVQIEGSWGGNTTTQNLNG